MKAIFGKRKYLLMFKYYVLKEGVSKEDENKSENLIGQQMIIINNVYKWDLWFTKDEVLMQALHNTCATVATRNEAMIKAERPVKGIEIISHFRF